MAGVVFAFTAVHAATVWVGRAEEVGKADTNIAGVEEQCRRSGDPAVPLLAAVLGDRADPHLDLLCGAG